MQQVEYGEISGVSFISVVRQKVAWNAWNRFFLLKNRSTMLINVFLSYEKISWNLNSHCDLTSFGSEKIACFCTIFLVKSQCPVLVISQIFLFVFRQFVFLVALQNYYMQKVIWDDCRCPFSQGWHLKKKAILGVLRSIC